MAENKNNAAWVSGAYYLAKPLLTKIREKFEGAEFFDCYENTLFSKLMTWLSSNSCFGCVGRSLCACLLFAFWDTLYYP
jgi:hypothetical protein